MFHVVSPDADDLRWPAWWKQTGALRHVLFEYSVSNAVIRVGSCGESGWISAVADVSVHRLILSCESLYETLIHYTFAARWSCVTGFSGRYYGAVKSHPLWPASEENVQNQTTQECLILDRRRSRSSVAKAGR